ncbi:MAG: hypothetical protein AAGA93_17115 [Actinomycetota bacterium]
MRKRRPRSATILATLTIGLLGAAASVLLGPVAPAAATNPDTIDLDALDLVPERTWGVSGQDPASTQTPTLDVLVWDFVQIGDRMFVAGGFLNVQESRDATPIPQAYVAAFDVDTGDWISTWTPELDRIVYAIDVLPNGSLLVGGEFETVNGQARRGLVALDPITGAIDPSFAGAVDRPWSQLRAMVREIEIDGSDIYVAGNFSHLDGVDGSRSRVYKVGRFADGTGRIDTTWRPEVTGSGVWGMDLHPARGEVHLSGFFSAVNGEPNTGYFHTVDAVTGATSPGKIDLPRNYTVSQPEIFDVAAGDGLVFTIGEQHIVQVLDADDHQMLGYHHTGQVNDGFEWTGGFAGGAYQAGERIGNVVYAGCHCTYSERNGFVNHYSSFTGRRTPHRVVMAYEADTGRLIESFLPDIHSPRDGMWSVASDTNGCLYIGGDLHVGGVDAGTPRWLGGFAKLCGDGPRLDGLYLEAESEWRYLDGGDAPAGWADPGFDDAAWPTGRAELGFGDGDENTVLTAGSVAYHARATFTVEGPLPTSLEVFLKADDGAVVYLNGTEVLRDNLPDGTIGPSTTALGWRAGADEDFRSFTVPADALVAGENTVAVSVRNVWSGNNDLGFDLQLRPSDVVVEVPAGPLVELGSSWRHTDSSAGAAPAGWPADIGDGVAGPDPAQFGFGGDGEVTALVGGQETYYFARTFEVDDPAGLDDLTLSLAADDGAVVYLNGVEVHRGNMPDGVVAWNTRPLTWRNGADERVTDHAVSGSSIVAGTNTVTVEIHNFWPGNADLSFDLGLKPAG